MPPRYLSLLCSCIVLVAMLSVWMLKKSTSEQTLAEGFAEREFARHSKPDRMPDAGARDVDSMPIAHQRKAPEVSMPLPQDFLQSILSADASGVIIPLPQGTPLSGTARKIRYDENGPLLIEGSITRPQAGRFYFHRQTIIGKAGALFGFIHFDEGETAYQVRPSGPDGSPMLVQTTVGEVMCRAFAAPPDIREIPAAHPIDDPVPGGENGIIQLQSLPAAAAVVYLDFDGEQRDFEYWGPIDAAHSGANNEQIFEVWQGVCEDFMPFNINVTTIRAVYDAATPGHRMQVVITPTDDAQEGAGGVAITNSFNNTGEIVCWAFLTTGKNAIEIISHEVGHTLGLSHDGGISPPTEYYAGLNGWAPIMGVGYSQPLTQWSKGEYNGANNQQDDLQIIDTNNGVDYRADDHGTGFANASWLNIDAGGGVSNEGIIETNADRDSYRFSTNGGFLELQIDPVPTVGDNVPISNLDIKAELLRVTSTLTTVLATSNSAATLAASFSNVYLDPGDYFVRVSGTGKGNPLTTGYTSYASLGSYTITGSVEEGIHAEQFTLAENTATGSIVGTVPPRADHDGGALIYQISGSPAFAIHPSNGQITVADGALLDFEAVSTRWDDPADFELFVTISDSNDHAVETIRTLVSLTDINEPPAAAAPALVRLPERSPTGTLAASVAASDPDRGDFVTYSITAGNMDGAFAIHPATGQVTVSGPLVHATTPSYSLTIRASDQLAPANHVDVTLDIQIVPVPAGYDPGSVTRTFFSGISGSSVAALTNSPNFPDKPNSEALLSSFDGGTGQGSQYGSTIRGWFIAPTSGDYTFWISADDSASLFISPDEDPQNATLRANISSPAGPGTWDLEPSQQSAAITLVAGGVHYIEARHKQSTGADHLQVAWQGPGMADKQIIPGTWLVPFRQPYAPWAAPQSLDVRDASVTDTPVGRVSFIEPNLDEEVATFAITGGNGQENFTIDPVSGLIRVAADAELAAGTNQTLTISATDDASPAATGETTVTIRVIRLDESLHAWWKLDETSGTTARDSSGNNRNANLSGDGTWITRDSANPALELNGTDARLDRYEFESLYADTPFTVAAWVRVPAGHDSEGVLIHQASGFITGVDRSFKVSITADGKVRFRIHETPTGTDQFDITTTQTIHDGTWHHVACVRDGETGRIFVDGVESIAAAGPVMNLYLDAYTSVGRDALANTDYLEATVDDIRIYAEALAAPQLLRIAGAPKVAIVHPSAETAVIPPGVGLLLEAAASDPNGLTPTVTWSQTGGPGVVTFGSAGATETTARFSTPGTYTLRATASDGTDDTSATLTVSAGNTASSPFAGFAYGGATSGSHSEISSSIREIQGASTGISEGATEDGFYLLGQTFSGDFDLRARVPATYDEEFATPWGSAGLVVRSGTSGLADEAGAFIGFNTTAGTGTWTRRTTQGGANLGTSYPGMTLPQWCRVTRAGSVVEFLHSADGVVWTSRGTMTFGGEIRAGLCWSSNTQFAGGSALFDNISGFSTSNVAAAVSAGAGFTALTGLPAALTGQTPDDGLPAPPALVTAGWEFLSGPGTVNIADPTQPVTSAVFSQSGVYQLRLVADDGALKTFDDVTITVTDPPPVVSVAATSPNASETGPQNGTFTFTRSVWLQGDLTVNFTLSGTADNLADYQEITTSILMPDGLETVTLDVVPLADALVEGPETVILTLAAGDYNLSGGEAVVTLADSNHAPSFSLNPIIGNGATQDTPYSDTLAGAATDPDVGDSLEFTKTTGPAWLIVATDGTLSGTPENDDAGTNAFTIRVTDNDQAFAETQLDIVVTNVNDDPVFSTNPVIGGDATEDVLYAGTLAGTATDPDVGDSLEFTKTAGPAWLMVAADGTLSGTPENDDAGTNAFMIRVTDNDQAFAETQLDIVVTNVNDDPVFSTNPVTGDDAIALASYTGTIAGTAGDPDDGDTLVFSKTSGPSWLVVNQNGGLSGTPEETDEGINAFTVTVTDLLGAVTSATLQITVLPPPLITVIASDPTAAETGPDPGVFTISRAGSASGDLTVSFTLNGSAINGSDYSLTVESVVIPDGDTSATVTMTPTADALVEGTESVLLTLANGPYDIGEPSSALLFIRDSNHAPFFLASPVIIPSALEGVAYSGESLADHAGDPNLDAGDELTFSKIDGPAWLMVATDGTLSGSPGVADVGIQLFTVRVTDAAGLFAEGNLQIEVTVPSSFETWQLAEFGALATNPLVAGELADPDQDDLVNLLEYALATDPNVPDTAGTELEVVDISGTDHLRVTYFLNPAATDITLSVEATNDPSTPGSWSDQNLLTEQLTTARLTVRDTLGGTRIFMRLKVSR